MLIIIEGSDKCGKSTLANKLVKEHGFEYIHCSQPKGDPYLEYWNILKQIELSGKDTVVDRLMYGEFVYGPIYRGKSQLSYTQLRNLEVMALGLNGLLIYCDDTIEHITKRFKADGETFAKAELLPKMLKLYKEVLNHSILPIIRHRIGGAKGMIDWTTEHYLERLLTQRR